MAPVPTTVHLPNGQTLTVTHVFGGFSFKANQLDVHNSAFPPGWAVILHTQDNADMQEDGLKRTNKDPAQSDDPIEKAFEHVHLSTHRFTKPTLNRDALFLSSISLPSNHDFQAPKSPTRQIAMMLWATLYWYFHQEAPSPYLLTEQSFLTPESGRPKGEWRVRIKGEGIFKGRNLLQKLERMGLITTEESSSGADTDPRHQSGWQHMFVSRHAFWQIDARIFLFSLSATANSPYPSSSPHPSRPASPARLDPSNSQRSEIAHQKEKAQAGVTSPGGPFASGSHLPTYFPPAPAQYIFTNHIRHPLRPKPPQQGQTFYTRYIPSVGQWLSFRVPSLSSNPLPHFGQSVGGSIVPILSPTASSSTVPTLSSLTEDQTDTELLHKWMNDPRVSAAWGCAGPVQTQQKFLQQALSSRHSFPALGCWDGKPFGYFEIYWVKEDRLGALLGGDVGAYSRGLHALVGEQEFRGAHRVKIWLSALVHYCWLADLRTETVILEPRVDNQKFIDYLQESGFYKRGEVSFPHKQSAVMRIERDAWEAPAL